MASGKISSAAQKLLHINDPKMFTQDECSESKIQSPPETR